jgi:hypothetical protein
MPSLTPTPSFPLTTVALTNPFGQLASVVITGGSVSAVYVNGVSAGTGGTYSVPPGGTISVTYTGSPSWTWSDFLNEDDEAYAASNTSGAYGAGQNLPTGAGHEVAGETGLGEAEDN